jgi:hypothetical protein
MDRKTLKNVRMTCVEIQPFLQNFHAALSDLRSAGVSISIEDQSDVILDNINAEFYLEAIRRIRQLGIGNDSLSYRLSRLDQLRRLADSHLNK